MDSMTKEEQQSMMILLMEDLRGSWGWDCIPRSNLVKRLAEALGYDKTVELCDSYVKNIDDWGDNDGRHFRCSFQTEGGYENPPFEVFRLIKNRSAEFIEHAELMNYPDHAFEDWNERYNK